jgi:hypothetical protein
MTDYLSAAALREANRLLVIRPRVPSFFEPVPDRPAGVLFPHYRGDGVQTLTRTEEISGTELHLPGRSREDSVPGTRTEEPERSIRIPVRQPVHQQPGELQSRGISPAAKGIRRIPLPVDGETYDRPRSEAPAVQPAAAHPFGADDGSERAGTGEPVRRPPQNRILKNAKEFPGPVPDIFPKGEIRPGIRREEPALAFPARPGLFSSPVNARYDPVAGPSRSAGSAGRPVIKVTIGRIDVRAVAPPPASRPPVPVQKSAVPTLEEYLKKRKEGLS